MHCIHTLIKKTSCALKGRGHDCGQFFFSIPNVHNTPAMHLQRSTMILSVSRYKQDTDLTILCYGNKACAMFLFMLV